MKTAVSLDGKRLHCKILTVQSITDMDLRGKSKTVPMLCQFFQILYAIKAFIERTLAAVSSSSFVCLIQFSLFLLQQALPHKKQEDKQERFPC